LIYWTPETGAHQVPGFAPNIIDKVGAGDALLSIISVLRMANIPIEVACFFGNIAGALLVGGIGNQVVLTHKSLLTEANEILSKIEESI
jgi:bifunctional ADP-heptose synthase (sugar kinase/adenylyltransferase)